MEAKVVRRIRGLGRGAVFTPTRFLRLGSRSAVDKALSRHCQHGTIRRLAQGLYDYPKAHPQFGVLAPATDAIAEALATSAQMKLQPSGAYAANLLGLSEQVPMKTVFLTTGTPRRVRVGPREVILKRTTPRQMATAGRISGLIIQSLRFLGKDQVDLDLLAGLRGRLSAADKRQLIADAVYAPGWVAAFLRNLAES